MSWLRVIYKRIFVSRKTARYAVVGGPLTLYMINAVKGKVARQSQMTAGHNVRVDTWQLQKARDDKQQVKGYHPVVDEEGNLSPSFYYVSEKDVK